MVPKVKTFNLYSSLGQQLQ